MYLLYLDESGNEDDPGDMHFVLGGAAVFERQTFFLSQDLDGLQAQHFPGLPPVEFHTSSYLFLPLPYGQAGDFGGISNATRRRRS